MTVYELISLQAPFEKLCKINPDANINVCVTKRKRPTLPIKVSLHFICNKIIAIKVDSCYFANHIHLPSSNTNVLLSLCCLFIRNYIVIHIIRQRFTFAT